MNNLSKKEQYFYGPVIPLLYSGNWNPNLHTRNSIGEFIYTDGGRHGGSPSADIRTTGPQATKNAIIAAANAWNKTAPRWRSANDCGAQAAALQAYLRSFLLKGWEFPIIGGEKLPIYLPFIGNFPHNILEVIPPSDSGLSPFTLDPYAGNNSSNNSRNVGVGTPSGFYGQYPWNDY